MLLIFVSINKILFSAYQSNPQTALIYFISPFSITILMLYFYWFLLFLLCILIIANFGFKELININKTYKHVLNLKVSNVITALIVYMYMLSIYHCLSTKSSKFRIEYNISLKNNRLDNLSVLLSCNWILTVLNFLFLNDRNKNKN